MVSMNNFSQEVMESNKSRKREPPEMVLSQSLQFHRFCILKEKQCKKESIQIHTSKLQGARVLEARQKLRIRKSIKNAPLYELCRVIQTIMAERTMLTPLRYPLESANLQNDMVQKDKKMRLKKRTFRKRAALTSKT